jgi:hypothetical protein
MLRSSNQQNPMVGVLKNDNDVSIGVPELEFPVGKHCFMRKELKKMLSTEWVEHERQVQSLVAAKVQEQLHAQPNM